MISYTLQQLIDRLEEIKLDKGPDIMCHGTNIFYKHATKSEPHRIEFYDYDENIKKTEADRVKGFELEYLRNELRDSEYFNPAYGWK